MENLPNISKVWMSHGDEIENIGLAFDVIGTSSNNVIGATPLTPSTQLSQLSCADSPKGLMAPTPVITTRLI